MKKTIASFKWATNGLKTVWNEERNFRIELFIGFLTIIGAFTLHFNALAWVLLIMTIIAVLAAEMVNTAVEDICNRIEPGHDTLIGKIKDIMAGFVLIVSGGALLVGIIIFSNFI